jgi:hypothetical protein
MDQFVANDGSFRLVRFAGHVALRPWLWGPTVALARNSSKASQALCSALVSYLNRETGSRQTVPGESLVAALNQRKDAPECASAHTRSDSESHTLVQGKQ